MRESTTDASRISPNASKKSKDKLGIRRKLKGVAILRKLQRLKLGTKVKETPFVPDTYLCLKHTDQVNSNTDAVANSYGKYTKYNR